MTSARALVALGRIDARGVGRDPLLRWVLLMPLVLTPIIRFGVPLLAERLAERFGFDLVPYYPLVTSFLLLFLPALVGMVTGFLLLDERDDGTLAALQVTPLGLGGYLVYRIATPMLASTVLTLAMLPLVGLVRVDPLLLVAAPLLAAPFAPIYALFLAAYARTKVEGFAIAKAAGVIVWPPVFAYFVAPEWQALFGILPTFWPMRFFWDAHAGVPGAWVWWVAGMAYQALVLALMMRRFDRATR
jgi:fluoroquinolone transport system permease protein